MGKSVSHKYRKQVFTASRAAKSQRIRRQRELMEKNKKISENAGSSTQVHDNIKATESSYDLPVISAVHGKDFFEKPPFSLQPLGTTGVHLEMTNSTVIKIETCEAENNSQDKIEDTVLKTIPQSSPEHHLKDDHILCSQSNNLGCETMHQEPKNVTSDKEIKVLFDVIKYLDDYAKADKFDLAGKLYAAKLRSVTFTNQGAIAENLCRQVLLEAEHFNLDEKIVLSSDSLNYCKSACNDTNKISLEPSFYLQLDKETLLQDIESRLSDSTKEDRFDKFGKHYATKMRSFSGMQYFYADKLINEIILEAELKHLRADYKLTKLGESLSHTFATGKSYAKEFRTIVPALPVADKACPSNKKLVAIACTNQKIQKKQSDELPIQTIGKSDDKQIMCSSVESSLAPLTPTIDVIPLKHNSYQLPKSLSSSSISKTVLKTYERKNLKKKSVFEKLTTDLIVKGFKNPSCEPSINSIMPIQTVSSVQSNMHKLPDSLPSLSICNGGLNTLNPNKI